MICGDPGGCRNCRLGMRVVDSKIMNPSSTLSSERSKFEVYSFKSGALALCHESFSTVAETRAVRSTG